MPLGVVISLHVHRLSEKCNVRKDNARVDVKAMYNINYETNPFGGCNKAELCEKVI